MYLKTTLAVLAGAAQLASAVPAANDLHVDPLLRLVKTSAEDAGQWVTEEEKARLVKAGHRVNFIDITDVEDESFLKILSTHSSKRTIETRQASYPDTLSHVEEANSLIAGVSSSGPQSWLQTLTEYVHSRRGPIFTHANSHVTHSFHNRHYQSSWGTEAATWLYETVQEVASANPAIEVEQFTHSFDQPSIIARIPGSSSSDKGKHPQADRPDDSRTSLTFT